MADIAEAFQKTENFKLLSGGLTGQSSVQAVNTLFQQKVVGCFMLVSDYVSRRAVMYVEESFVEQAKRVMPNNPSYQGWIFEFECLYRISKKSLAICGESIPGQSPSVWNNHSAIVKFHDFDDSCLNGVMANTLLIPSAYNQGLFDIMLFEQQGVLRIANITLAKLHLFNMSLIAPYLEKFKLPNGRCTLHFDILIPLENINSYKVSTKHFQWKHAITRYDDKWKAGAPVNSLCQVFLVDRNSKTGGPALSNRYTFPVEDVSIPTNFHMVLRKRPREQGINDDVFEDMVEDASGWGIVEYF
jgi:hypothetical protein